MVAVLEAAAATFGLASMYFKTPRHSSSFTGEQWVSELLKGHDVRFSDQFEMSKHLFKHLLKELEEKANLAQQSMFQQRSGLLSSYTPLQLKFPTER